MRQARYFLEGASLLLVYGFFRALPLDAASAVGGWIARAIGPRLRFHRIALWNLALAFPEADEERITAIAAAMWDNLGRTVAEFPHVATENMAARIRILGGEHFERALAEGKPCLFVSGHLGNWEIAARAAAASGMKLHLIYRQLSNPYVDALARRVRLRFAAGVYPKDRRTPRALMRVARAGGSIGMLADQKTNDGVLLPFFGHPAPTSTVAARLAIAHDLPIYMARVRRVGGAHFAFSLLPPTSAAATGDRNEDARAIMLDIHRQLEAWIRDDPAQWFWVHKRWAMKKGVESSSA